MTRVITGLESLLNNQSLIKSLKGNVALLCHSASITSKCKNALPLIKSSLGKRLVKVFGPQHGFSSDVQDNMVETNDIIHPFFKIPIISLYSQTRIPTPQMLKGINTLLVDLQDVGCRVYTYISTLGLIMSVTQNTDIELVILDRPNPTGGKIIEGNILDINFKSFVGHFPIPMRHGMTLGEVALYAKRYQYPNSKVRIIKMKNWKRDHFFRDTGLPWANPSPNLPTPDGSLIFPGTVLFEGTNISEGRGTTRSLEIVGHPKIGPFSQEEKILTLLKECNLKGFTLRPLTFMPTFQKYKNINCGGFQIHITNPKLFRPWLLGQFLLKFFHSHLGNNFSWNKKPYEYEYKTLAIDLINGTDQIRRMVEEKNDIVTHFRKLKKLEKKGRQFFLNQRENILLYT